MNKKIDSPVVRSPDLENLKMVLAGSATDNLIGANLYLGIINTSKNVPGVKFPAPPRIVTVFMVAAPSGKRKRVYLHCSRTHALAETRRPAVCPDSIFIMRSSYSD